MRTLALMMLGGLVLAGCEGPEGPPGEIGAAGPEGPAGNPGLDGADGGAGPDGATGPEGPSGPTGPTGDDGLNGTAFTFRTDAPGDYTRVDRMGMPAVATAVITSKDDYNAGDPVDDATYAAEITTNVEGLHTALDDDLNGLGLTECVPADCVAAAAPLVIPDTLKIDVTAGAGFPNGRLLEDPVIDITLALVLLDVTPPAPPHTLTDLVGVTNPAANDVPFMGLFPYVAAPHM